MDKCVIFYSHTPTELHNDIDNFISGGKYENCSILEVKSISIVFDQQASGAPTKPWVAFVLIKAAPSRPASILDNIEQVFNQGKISARIYQAIKTDLDGGPPGKSGCLSGKTFDEFLLLLKTKELCVWGVGETGLNELREAFGMPPTWRVYGKGVRMT